MASARTMGGTPAFATHCLSPNGISLHEKFPSLDPLTVRFTDLHRWVTELDGFTGDPAASNEAKLEAIQMAWIDEAN